MTNIGGSKQKGIITYGLSANRQNPFAGAGHDAIFNTWRRFSKQVLYVAPPFVFFYYVMNWAVDRYVTLRIAGCTRWKLTVCRNHYLNSKAGREEFKDSE